jgi:hypothetical protein
MGASESMVFSKLQQIGPQIYLSYSDPKNQFAKYITDFYTDLHTTIIKKANDKQLTDEQQNTICKYLDDIMNLIKTNLPVTSNELQTKVQLNIYRCRIYKIIDGEIDDCFKTEDKPKDIKKTRIREKINIRYPSIVTYYRKLEQFLDNFNKSITDALSNKPDELPNGYYINSYLDDINDLITNSFANSDLQNDNTIETLNTYKDKLLLVINGKDPATVAVSGGRVRRKSKPKKRTKSKSRKK